MPEGEEEEQEIENLFENIMKENFPNLAKEIDFQEVQEAQRVPKKLGFPRRNTPRHIIITLAKIKDKERIFFKKIFYLFIFREGEGEKEGEKHQCVVASHVPASGGPALQPRHVPMTGN